MNSVSVCSGVQIDNVEVILICSLSLILTFLLDLLTAPFHAGMQ